LKKLEVTTMSVIRYQPWNVVNRLQRDIERTFAREFGGGDVDARASAADIDDQVVDWTPAVDVRETANAFVLTADVPGVDPKDIDVTMENGLLTIRGARRSDSAGEAAEQDGYRRIERVSGRFLRRFTLPETANAEAVTAKTSHGVLTLTIPKRAEVQPRRIEIQAA
jgi:HSP20 family protein